MPFSFTKNVDAGLLLLRLFVGIRLLYGVQDNILHWSHMKNFEAFLAAHHFPVPLFSAILSVYAQAIAGILYIIGWQVRWAAAVMAVNFCVAFFMVHWGQSFEETTTVLFMLVSSLVLLLSGGGRYGLRTV
ncbi:MAG: DoxX family protein [Chitinophagaceae bacterium]|nr:MAG: DoxX family protein [Chitinophagaceae bacterium]